MMGKLFAISFWQFIIALTIIFTTYYPFSIVRYLF